MLTVNSKYRTFLSQLTSN